MDDKIKSYRQAIFKLDHAERKRGETPASKDQSKSGVRLSSCIACNAPFGACCLSWRHLSWSLNALKMREGMNALSCTALSRTVSHAHIFACGRHLRFAYLSLYDTQQHTRSLTIFFLMFAGPTASKLTANSAVQRILPGQEVPHHEAQASTSADH